MMKDGKMGLFSCVALIISACVGSAIFSISGMTVYMAGGSAILSWVIAALIFCAYGMLLAELAVRYPDSGGIYVFPKRAFSGAMGSFWGLVSAWGYIVSNIIAVGFSAIYVGEYLCAGFPGVRTMLDGVIPGLSADEIISLISLVLSATVILSGPKRSQFIQNILSMLLAATLLLYCGFAFFGGGFEVSNFHGFFTSGAGKGTGFISAVPLAMVAYGGCVVVSFMASEVRNPSRNVPVSLFLGLGAVALIYAAVIASIAGTLPIEVLDGDVSLRFIPLFASISNGTLSSYGWMARLVSICGVLALLTTITALLRVNARAVQAISAEGYFPDFLATENRRGVLSVTIIILTVIAACLCLFPQWTVQMITLGAVLNIASMTITCLSFIMARRHRSHSGGFMAPAGGFLAVTLIVLFWVCYVPDVLNGGNMMWLFTAVVYVIALTVWLAGRKRSRRRLHGLVVHGKGRGHLHSMPTANLKPFRGQDLPGFGVWSVKVFYAGKYYRGLSNVGLRPSDDDSPIPSVETLIFDFDEDIYGKKITLEFEKFIRPTRKFSNLDELRTQIELDIKGAGEMTC